jgi:hypothetical protein
MEEKRIFDLVLVKYGLFLVNCGNILVKCGRFLEIFGIDVGNVTAALAMSLRLSLAAAVRDEVESPSSLRQNGATILLH